MKNTILQNLGFDGFFEAACNDLGIEMIDVARVVAEHKGIYIVKNSSGEFRAKVTGKYMFSSDAREDYPIVGDWVEISMIDNDQAIIDQILPRKTVIRKTVSSRKSPDRLKNQIIAANVDVAFVVESVDRDYSLNRFERYFALAKDGKVEPSIILNKVDLITHEDLIGKLAEINERFKNCKVIPTSSTTEQGLSDLRDALETGETYCFLGSSGVGKSSLINALLGEGLVKTGEISNGNGRGKHVTTHREIYVLKSGGIVIDNPGMREVGATNSEDGVGDTFGEITDYAPQCKFKDCTHIHESECAVLAAVESGLIDTDRYDNYIRLKKESEHYEMTDYERRDKDKKFGQSIKNYHKQMKDFEE